MNSFVLREEGSEIKFIEKDVDAKRRPFAADVQRSYLSTGPEFQTDDATFRLSHEARNRQVKQHVRIRYQRQRAQADHFADRKICALAAEIYESWFSPHLKC